MAFFIPSHSAEESDHFDRSGKYLFLRKNDSSEDSGSLPAMRWSLFCDQIGSSEGERLHLARSRQVGRWCSGQRLPAMSLAWSSSGHMRGQGRNGSGCRMRGAGSGNPSGQIHRDRSRCSCSEVLPSDPDSTSSTADHESGRRYILMREEQLSDWKQPGHRRRQKDQAQADSELTRLQDLQTLWLIWNILIWSSRIWIKPK